MLKNDRKAIALALLMLASLAAYSQNIVTAQAGAWNNTNTWVGGVVPTAANSTTITLNHNVSVPNGFSVTIDGTTVSAGVTLTVNTGGTLDIANAGGALVVNGTLVAQNASSITGSTGTNVDFNSGSLYRHLFTITEGVIPEADWHANSTMRVEGYTTFATTTAGGNWDQDFGNVEFNMTQLRSGVFLNLSARLTSIAGDFTVSHTGSGSLLMTDAETATVAIGGDFNISGVSRVRITRTGNCTFNIAGDFNQSAGVLTSALDTNGQFIMNLSGDFNLTGGSISEVGTGTAAGTFRFVGSNVHQFVNTGTIVNTHHWYIGPNETVDLDIYPIKSSSNSIFTLDGGTIIVGSTHASGAIQMNTSAGNIQLGTVAGGRIYANGSTIIYRSASAQFMGNGQPGNTGITTIIDNAAGVSLASDVTIGGTLDLDEGQLFLSSFTLNFSGAFTYGTGTLGGDASSTLVIDGTAGGSVGTLVFGAPNAMVGTLTINRTGGGVSAVLNSTLTIATQLDLLNGQLNNVSGLTMGNGATIFRFPSGILSGSRPAVTGADTYNVTYRTTSSGAAGVRFSTALELPDPTDQSSLNNLTILLQVVRDTLDLEQDLFINGTVDLARGQFYGNDNTITMAGPSWLDNSGNFNEGANGLVIFVATTTVDGSSNPVFTNIQANAGSVVTFNRNFSIAGNIDFQAGSTVAAPAVTMSLNGTTLQTIAGGGNALHNITIAKSGGNVQLTTSALGVIGLLRFTSPSVSVDLQSNGFLTLISTSDAAGDAINPGTGQIYRLVSGNSVSGNVIVQRFMSGEGRIYRYMSSPISNGTVSQWQDDIPITGNFPNPSSGTVCGNKLNSFVPSMYYYSEPEPGLQDEGWRNYPAGTHSTVTPLAVGRGYAIFVRECAAPTVVDVSGPVNQGTITFPVMYTDTGNGDQDGYNLLGNPYPCTIDWDISGWAKARISPVIAIMDNGAGGVMRYWDGDGDPNTLANGQIAPGQAFWVRATAASPILRCTENVKGITPNQVGEFYRVPTSDVLTITLSNGVVRDKAFLKVRHDSKPTLDDWDAPKLANQAFDVYTISPDNVKMAINATNEIQCVTDLNIGIRNLAPGEYSLALDKEGIFSGYRYILHDNFTNQDVAFTGSYSFVVNENPLSNDAGRFTLSMDNTIRVTPATLCGAGSTTLEAEGSNLRWYATETSTQVLATGSTFETPWLNKTSTYYVASDNGCETGRVPVKAEVVHMEAPVISADHNLLSVNYSDVKWLYNNAEIAGSTGSQLVAVESGVYSAVVTGNGCQSRADHVYLAPSFEGNAENLVVYPNPIGTWMKLQMKDNAQVSGALLIDGSGSKVLLKPQMADAREIHYNTDHVSVGFYILEVTLKNRSTHYFKVIKK